MKITDVCFVSGAWQGKPVLRSCPDLRGECRLPVSTASICLLSDYHCYGDLRHDGPGSPQIQKDGKTRRSILVLENGVENGIESLSEEVAGQMDDHQPTALFDRHARPSLPARMRMQAFMMAGVALLFLCITIAIGIVLPTVPAWLQ